MVEKNHEAVTKMEDLLLKTNENSTKNEVKPINEKKK